MTALGPTEVRIGKVTVDINDPCAVLTELRKARLVAASDKSVSMARFGDDETRWTEANLAGLKELISEYEGLCARASGRRRRFAKGVSYT